MKTNSMINTSNDVWKYFLRKKAILVIGWMTLVLFTFILSKAIPYELFSH
jgi:hypothetical protein